MVSPPVPKTIVSSFSPGCIKHNGDIYDSFPSGIVSAARILPDLLSNNISTPGNLLISEYGSALEFPPLTVNKSGIPSLF
jgi:hypothetical protein